jgi:hypothetical protein
MVDGVGETVDDPVPQSADLVDRQRDQGVVGAGYGALLVTSRVITRKAGVVIDSVMYIRSISNTSTSIELHLGPYPCLIKVTGSDPDRHGVSNAIDVIANRCLRLRFLHRTLHSIWHATLSTVAGAALIIYGVTELEPAGTDPLLLNVVLSTAGLTSAVLAFVVLRPLSSVLYTRTRQVAPPFWQRKRDDIIIAAVSLMLGGIIGYCINIITT